MRLIATPESRLELSKALRFMTEALDILDKVEAPGEIGSTLDLAAARLEKFVSHDDQAAPAVERLISQLEREFQTAPTITEGKPSPWDNPPVR